VWTVADTAAAEAVVEEQMADSKVGEAKVEVTVAAWVKAA